MANEWRAVTLGEVFKVKHGFAFKGEYFTDEPQETVLVTPGNFAIGGGFQAGKRKYYNGPVPEDYVLKPGQVVVTMTDLSKESDTLGYAASIPDDSTIWLHNQRVGLLEFKPAIPASPRFIQYLLRTHKYRSWIVGSATGTTVKHTSPSRIESFATRIPLIEEQRAIAHILGTLDDKIELNRGMNETLEQMARALFKAWFVDFEPVRAKMEGRWQRGQSLPGLPASLYDLFPDRLVQSELGEIPEEWEIGSVYDIANVRYGAPFASSKFNTEGDGWPLVRIRDLRDERPGVWTPEVHPKGYLIQPGDIIVGMDGEFRSYLWAGEPAWLNQRICAFHPKKPHSASFVRNAIIPLLAHVEATEVATTVIHLGKRDIDQFRVVVPTNDVAASFERICQPLYNKIVTGKQESRALANLRDTLLPKLISGELRIPDVERIVGAAV